MNRKLLEEVSDALYDFDRSHPLIKKVEAELHKPEIRVVARKRPDGWGRITTTAFEGCDDYCNATLILDDGDL
jgi:hypothetical protein